MFNTIHTLTPAYGRDYKSRLAAIESLEAGKDWLSQPENKPCSIRDLQPGATVTLRFGQLRKVTRYTVKPSTR